MTDSESHQSQGGPVKYFSVVMYLLRERQQFLEEIRQGVKLKSKIFGLVESRGDSRVRFKRHRSPLP
ncbi:hypothetical protein QUA11_11440 [Microcoleus sp. S13_D1]|uniref:hypothetical protein n=1 Tax=Microcoleus sp. AT13-A5 TaxID=2818590 RepID=UPI002FD38640